MLISNLKFKQVSQAASSHHLALYFPSLLPCQLAAHQSQRPPTLHKTWYDSALSGRMKRVCRAGLTGDRLHLWCADNHSTNPMHLSNHKHTEDASDLLHEARTEEYMSGYASTQVFLCAYFRPDS